MSLSRKDIKDYNSSTNEQEKHLIEKKALEDNFDADALDGWSENDLSKSLTKMDKKFIKSKPFYYNFYFISVISILLIVGILVVTFKTASNEKTKTENQLIVQSDIIPSEINLLKELPIQQQISVNDMKKDFKLKQKASINSPKENHSGLKKEEELLEIKLNSKKIETNANIEKTIKKYGKEIYLHDLKLLDYRAYRENNKIKTEQLFVGGTPANKENNQNVEEASAMQWKSIEIPYHDYLEKTMKLFSKGNIKSSLVRFEEILMTYPDDVNALFYAGLCYYNLSEFDKAINYFEESSLSKYKNFDEEADWYIAKSYQAKNELVTAIEYYKKIVLENGYYSEQAKVILKKINK